MALARSRYSPQALGDQVVLILESKSGAIDRLVDKVARELNYICHAISIVIAQKVAVAATF